jgi:hypothetical protein
LHLKTFRLVLIPGWLLMTIAAEARPVTFELRPETGGTIVLTARGDETVFWPQLSMLDRQGGWLALHPDRALTQLSDAQALRFDGQGIPTASVHPDRIVRVSYYDKAGTSLNQLASLAARRDPAEIKASLPATAQGLDAPPGPLSWREGRNLWVQAAIACLIAAVISAAIRAGGGRSSRCRTTRESPP